VDSKLRAGLGLVAIHAAAVGGALDQRFNGTGSAGDYGRKLLKDFRDC
jgi:hypothetical protein